MNMVPPQGVWYWSWCLYQLSSLCCFGCLAAQRCSMAQLEGTEGLCVQGMRGLTRGGGSGMNMVAPRESGRGAGISTSWALLAALATRLRSAAS